MVNPTATVLLSKSTSLEFSISLVGGEKANSHRYACRCPCTTGLPFDKCWRVLQVCADSCAMKRVLTCACCLRMKCWGEYLDPTERKWQEDWKNYIMITFIISTLHQVLLGS